MELMVTYVIGVIIVMLIGPPRLAAIYAAWRAGDVVRDPVPSLDIIVRGDAPAYGEFARLGTAATWLSLTPDATHTPGNCESCGSQEFRTHRGVDICSYCRSVA